jgi:hypothetical protein
MLSGLSANSHQGYTRLESEEDPPLSPRGGGQVGTINNGKMPFQSTYAGDVQSNTPNKLFCAL